jgi:hypothetical protein
MGSGPTLVQRRGGKDGGALLVRKPRQEQEAALTVFNPAEIDKVPPVGGKIVMRAYSHARPK